jgi:hypothetical protein
MMPNHGSNTLRRRNYSWALVKCLLIFHLPRTGTLSPQKSRQLQVLSPTQHGHPERLKSSYMAIRYWKAISELMLLYIELEAVCLM